MDEDITARKAMAASLRAAGFSYETIAPLINRSANTAWYWLNPERAKKYQREWKTIKRLDPDALAKMYSQRRAYEDTFEGAIKCRLSSCRTACRASGLPTDTLNFDYVIQRFTGYCDICGKAWADANRSRQRGLCIDHDHATGKFRGFLCHECNLAIAGFQDSPAVLNKAISYLQKCT